MARWRPIFGHLVPWPIVGLRLLASCLLALLGPFWQSQCTSYVPSTSWAAQIPGPAPLGGHPGEVELCTNVVSRGAFYALP